MGLSKCNKSEGTLQVLLFDILVGHIIIGIIIIIITVGTDYSSTFLGMIHGRDGTSAGQEKNKADHQLNAGNFYHV